MNPLLDWPSPTALRISNLVLLAATVSIALAAFVPLEHDLEAGAGYGIVSFELAFTNARVREILDSWAARDAFDAARTSLYIDFVYLVAYAGLFAGVVVWAARRFRGRAQTFGLALAPWCLGAGFFDAVENALALTTLYLREVRSGDIGTALPLLTGIFATAKFAILVLAAGYCVAGIVRALR